MWSYLCGNGHRKRLLLLAGDSLLLVGVCLLFLGGGRPEQPAPPCLPEPDMAAPLLLAALGVLGCRFLVGDVSPPGGWARWLTVAAPPLAAAALGLAAWLFPAPPLPAQKHSPLLLSLLLGGVLVCVWHAMAEKALLRPTRLLLAGRPQSLAELAGLLRQAQDAFQVVGHWTPSPESPADLLLDLVRRHRADLVVYAPEPSPADEALVQARLRRIPVMDAATFMQNLTGRVPVYAIQSAWLLTAGRQSRSFPRLAAAGKRLLDLILAGLLLPLAIPVLCLCALAIKLDSRGPIFFIQERLGKDGLPFRLIKLRTMVTDAEQTGPQWCRDGDPRITRVGRVLRRLRLDELPQIFNVLKNDMSFVGPRPIRQHFTDLLAAEIPFYRLRLLAKPGVSGWAQVHCGHANTVAAHAQMLQYDLFYLLHQSFWLDLLILLKTVKVMLTGQGR